MDIFVRPAPLPDGAPATRDGSRHFRVRNPDQDFTPLPEGGDFVSASPYWNRMIREGAVITGHAKATSKE